MNSRNTILTAAILALAISKLGAQVGSGVIVGTVFDPSQAGMPGVQVSIESLSTRLTIATATNDSGRYQSPPLNPGEYRITISKSGFKQATGSVQLEVDQRLAMDFHLELGSTSENVTVQAVAPLIESESSTLGNLRTSKAVSELPLNARNFAFLITLSAGTVPRFNQSASLAATTKLGVTNASVNGARPTNEWNSIMIDGIDTGENHNGWGIAVYPPVDAIQEFRIQTSAADAQYGRAAGGFTNVVIKSGTAQLHGSLYEFHRNSALDAKNYFAAPTDTSRFILNQFGGTIGGPVIIPHVLHPSKPSTFFFYSMQGDIRRQALNYVTSVPTALMRQGNFSELPSRIYDPLSISGNTLTQFPNNIIPANRLDPTGKKLMDLYPLPTRAGIVNNFTYSPSHTYDTYQHDFKIDQYFSEKNTLTFRGTVDQSKIYDPGVLPAPANGGNTSGVTGTQNTPGRQFDITDHHIFGTNRVNEFRFGFTRMGLTILNPSAGQQLSQELGIPGVNTGSLLQSGLTQFNITGYSGLGDWGFTPAILASNNFQVEDTFYYNKSKHALRFGGRADRRQYNAFQTNSTRGIITFSGGFTQNPASAAGTGSAEADLLLGAPASGSIQILDGTRGFRRTDYGFFIQDDWKISSNLTLNLGLRYELYNGYPWTEVGNRMAQFDLGRDALLPVDQNGIPSSGVAPDRTNFEPRLGLAYKVRPKTVIRTAYGIYYAAPVYQISSNLALNPPFAGTFAYTNNQLDFPGARKLSQGFERTFDAQSSALNAIDPNLRMPYMQQWNFNVQQQLPADSVVTVAYVGTKGTKLFDLWNYNQPRPGPGAVNARRPLPAFNDIMYTAFVGNSDYDSLQVTFDKRYSKGLSVLATYTWAHAIDTTDTLGAAHQDSQDLAADRGDGEFDVRHTAVFSFTWDLPGLKSHAASARYLIGGWQISGITRLSTGQPFTVTTAVNTLNGSGAQRANVVPGCNPNLANPSPGRWFNTACFSVPASFQFGNAGRNILHGPGTDQLDLALHKSFPFRSAEGGPRIEFRAEAFNLSNTPQFNNPASAIGVPGAGVITSAGSPISFQRTSRQIQLALKLLW